MPKLIEYPRTNFKKCLELISVFPKVGENPTLEQCAKALNKSMSGVFITLVGSAAKFNLIESFGDTIKSTNLSDKINNAKANNNEVEYLKLLDESLFNPVPYSTIYNKYEGSKISKEEIARIFEIDYDCPPKFSGRATKYFLESLEFVNLYDKKNLVIKTKNEFLISSYKTLSKTNNLQDFKTNKEVDEKLVLRKTKNTSLPQNEMNLFSELPDEENTVFKKKEISSELSPIEQTKTPPPTSTNKKIKETSKESSSVPVIKSNSSKSNEVMFKIQSDRLNVELNASNELDYDFAIHTISYLKQFIKKK